MSDIFEGELLLEDSPDFGEIKIENGLFVCDRSFSTGVYISLFGGNKDDNGKVKNKYTWWGNTLNGVNENEKMISRFQNIIFGLPMTSKNIQRAENAAQLDLKWFIDEGIADKVIAQGRATGLNKFAINIHLIKSGTTIYDNTFSLFWRAGIYGENI
jgi:phage gp46-like protein